MSRDNGFSDCTVSAANLRMRTFVWGLKFLACSMSNFEMGTMHNFTKLRNSKIPNDLASILIAFIARHLPMQKVLSCFRLHGAIEEEWRLHVP